MHGFRSLLVALVAATTLVAASPDGVAADVVVAQRDSAFAHHNQARGRTVRSIVLDHGKRLKIKREIQSQQEAARNNEEWTENFHKQNAAWQKAANESLKQGKTPLEFDEWVKSQGGDSDSSDSSSDSQPTTTSSAASLDVTGSAGNQNLAQSAKQCKSKTTTAATAAATSSNDDDSQDDEVSDDSDSDSDSTSSSAASSSSPSATKSSSSSASSSSSSSSSSGGLANALNVVQNGKATFYNTGLGACGWTNKDSDYIVALPVGVWNQLGGSVSNGNVVCGKKLAVSNGKGKQIEVVVTDQCPSCDPTHLDLSPSAFSALGNQNDGVIKISWGWVGSVPHQ